MKLGKKYISITFSEIIQKSTNWTVYILQHVTFLLQLLVFAEAYLHQSKRSNWADTYVFVNYTF